MILIDAENSTRKRRLRVILPREIGLFWIVCKSRYVSLFVGDNGWASIVRRRRNSQKPSTRNTSRDSPITQGISKPRFLRVVSNRIAGRLRKLETWTIIGSFGNLCVHLTSRRSLYPDTANATTRSANRAVGGSHLRSLLRNIS